MSRRLDEERNMLTKRSLYRMFTPMREPVKFPDGSVRDRMVEVMDTRLTRRLGMYYMG